MENSITRKAIVLLASFLILLTLHAQKEYVTVSGKVTDPYTGKGISNAFVAVQGHEVSAFFGGPEYFYDLALNTTDANGEFAIRVPTRLIDSFAKENSFLNYFDFYLETRTIKSSEFWDLYKNAHLSGSVNIDTCAIGKPCSRAAINHNCFPLTGSRQVLKKDTSGINITLHKAGLLHIIPHDPTAFIHRHCLFISTNELRKDNTVFRQSQICLDNELDQSTIVRPYIPMNIYIGQAHYENYQTRYDTLVVLHQVMLNGGEIKEIRLPAARNLVKKK